MITLLVFFAGIFVGFFVRGYRRANEDDTSREAYRKGYTNANGLYEVVKRK